jgi:quercetin dioxygenase-like cupin family protein
MKVKFAAALAAGLFLMAAPTVAQQSTGPKILVEKKVTSLPAGPLFWRIDNFPTVAQAETAAGPMGLVAEAAGKVWLFTLGPAGEESADGAKVAEVGPLPGLEASEYLLQIREAKSPPGSMSPVHTHPGAEAFYVLAGEQTRKSLEGVAHLAAGEGAAGLGADKPMQVSNNGSAELHTLVMFVLDASKPFSSPAEFK